MHRIRLIGRLHTFMDRLLTSHELAGNKLAGNKHAGNKFVGHQKTRPRARLTSEQASRLLQCLISVWVPSWLPMQTQSLARSF